MKEATILNFLSNLPLRRSSMKCPESIGEANEMPKIKMDPINSTQQLQLQQIHEVMQSDILTDGTNHFMLMGGFVAHLIGPVELEGDWAEETRKELAEIVPQLPPIVDDGLYVGKVLAISDGAVTQKVNRDGATVRHLMSQLSAPVEIDAVIEISYTGGVGEVASACSRMVQR